MDAFTASVSLLQGVPPAPDHQGIRHALELLADSVENVPYEEGPAAQQAATLMRNNWLRGNDLRPPADPRPQVHAKRALQYATGAFRMVASNRARDVPELEREVIELERSVAALDENVGLIAQHDAVLRALSRAGSVLEVIARAPRPGVAEMSVVRR